MTAQSEFRKLKYLQQRLKSDQACCKIIKHEKNSDNLSMTRRKKYIRQNISYLVCLQSYKKIMQIHIYCIWPVY